MSAAPGERVETRWRATPGQRVAAVAAWTLAGFYLVGGALYLLLREQAYVDHAPHVVGTPVVLDAVLLPPFLAFALVGAVIVTRRPRQRIGWILLGVASCFVASVVGEHYAIVALGPATAEPSTLALLAAWLQPVAWIVFMALALVFLPLLYPDGRPPSPRWRPVAGLFAVVVLVGVVMAGTADRLEGRLYPPGGGSILVYDVANPLAMGLPQGLVMSSSAVTGALSALTFAAMVILAPTAVVVRFRRSRGVERQRMKWFTFAFAAVASGGALFGVVVLIDVAMAGDVHPLAGDVAFLAWMLMLTGLPVAIGIAVLRYRLYEIDRIVSRTVSYGLVVVVLGLVYAGGVVGVGAAVSGLTGQEDSDLVVAASVLAVVALFGPVRTRVQGAVDRRFNRTGYQAGLAVEAFAEQLRDEVDLEAIRRGVGQTAATSHQPAHVSVWLAGAGDER